MQNGSMIRTERQGKPAVWEFRWRENGPDGKRRHRRMVVGSVNQFADAAAARLAVAALHLNINHGDIRVNSKPLTLAKLVDHYRQRDLPGLCPKMDHAALGTLHAVSDQCRRGGTVVTISSIGPIQLRKDQKHHERALQPWDAT